MLKMQRAVQLKQEVEYWHLTEPSMIDISTALISVVIR